MNRTSLILYATIKDFEHAERLRLSLESDDVTFDGFEHFAKKLGHKSASALRKMCEPHGRSYGAKLGFDEAMIIMTEANDYRLLRHMEKDLVERKAAARRQQTDLFSAPCREVKS